MDNQSETQTMKIRSARACIAEGYRLYTNHFRTIFRRTWMAAVFYSLVIGVLGTFCVVKMPRMAVLYTMDIFPQEAVLKKDLMMLVWFVLLEMVYAVAVIWMVSCGTSILREHLLGGQIAKAKKWYIPLLDRPVIWRVLKAVACLTVIGLIVLFIMSTTQRALLHVLSPMATKVAISLIILLVVMLLLPLVYITTKYLLTTQTAFWKLTIKDYSVAFRRIGLIFVIVLVTALIVLLIQGFISMPAIILTEANVQANMGVLMGDPLGMPSFMTGLTASVFFFAGFVQAYTHMSMLFPAYYMYGTIETQEQERKNEKNPIH